MIHFTLTNFFNNFHINENFKLLYNTHKNFFKTNLNFSTVDGNFPYCYWNGGYNNNIGPGVIYDNFFTLNNDTSIPLRINCSNIYLQKKDFYDTMANTILKICENGSNEIELSNLELFNYLKNKYPNYKYIFSKEADLINPFTPDIINCINESKNFKLISLPPSLSKNLNFLKQIENKKNIELSINATCDINCENYNKCLLQSHISQYNYSKENYFNICKKRKPYQEIDPLISLEDIEKIYIPLGFTHFSIGEINHNDIDNYKDFLIKYFIKPEYYYEASLLI